MLSVFVFFLLQTNPYGMKEGGGGPEMSWSGSGLAATSGYYSYDHSTLAAYG